MRKLNINDYEYLNDLMRKPVRSILPSWNNRYLESAKIYEFIFRLANYAHPQTILEIGTSGWSRQCLSFMQ